MRTRRRPQCADKREELRLQALAALRQLITRAPECSGGGGGGGGAADAAARVVAHEGAHILVSQLTAGHAGLISPLSVGEAALALDAVCERSSVAESQVFRLNASAPLADAVADVLRTRRGGAGLDPKREAATPWALEQSEAFDRW